MAIPTPAGYSIFVTTVSTLLGHVYDEDDVESVWNKVSSEDTCDSEQMIYVWTGLMPKMRLWTGARQPHQPAAQTYTVVPQPWENTYSIDRFKLDDDKFGVYYREIPDMARQSRRNPDYQLRDLVEASGVQTGTRQNGTDGLSFWNTAHPVDVYNSSAGTYVNDFTGGGVSVGGVTVGGAIGQQAITSLAEYMRTIKGEDGERLGVRMTHLMYPVTLETEVNLFLKSTFFAPPSWGAFSPVTGQVGAADNPLLKMGITPLENQFLNSNTKWYGLDLSKPRKPFTRVVREAVRMVPRMNENDPAVFDTHTFQWGEWNRECPAWGFSFLAARSGP
jgi:phage major head subunit gpT-like protein